MSSAIDQIQSKLSEIKKLGYVKTLRKGPTGIGYTLETLLEISENNISSPDLGDIELKAHRENHAGLITLFTFNRNVWRMKPLEAIRRYGRENSNGRLGMYYTMGIKPNDAGLFLCVDDELVSVKNVDGSVIAEWQLTEIERRFETKVKNVLLVQAKVKRIKKIDYFLFNRARLLSHGTTKAILKSQFENRHLLLDLRLHDKGTSARNHGTGFRIYENNLSDLYRKVEEIEF